MNKAARYLFSRVGRRGAFLSFLAILNISYGYSLFATEAPQRAFDLLLPWQTWGIIWIATGVSYLFAMFMRRDWWAFTVAATIKGAWACVFADVWLIQGVTRGWVSVVVWLAFALTVLVIGGWPEPVHGIVVIERDTISGDTVTGDTITGDTISGDTMRGDTLLGEQKPEDRA